jgi:hypothetical protein
MLPVPAAAEDDWIDEGLAEYLSLVLLERSGTISRERFGHAIDTFRRRGNQVRNIRTSYASGKITARAVSIFHDLDRERMECRTVDLLDSENARRTATRRPSRGNPRSTRWRRNLDALSSSVPVRPDPVSGEQAPSPRPVKSLCRTRLASNPRRAVAIAAQTAIRACVNERRWPCRNSSACRRTEET